MKNFRGFFAGIIAASSFGMIPLFSVPLLKEGGYSIETVLSYRHIVAALLVALLYIVKFRESFKINLKEFLSLFLCGLCYYFSAALLFSGYQTMTTGLATTLHFLYPVFVTLIMHFFFKQRISPFTIIAIILALTGVSMLCLVGKSTSASILGFILVILSGLAYAIYIVIINNITCLRTMNNLKLTFYTMVFCGLIFIAKGSVLGSLKPITGSSNYIYLLLLALVPTLVSNIALVKAIKLIGSTLTSVLGAMEPLVAIILGIIAFNEEFTLAIGIGIFLIIAAVCIIISSPLLDKNISLRLTGFKIRMKKSIMKYNKKNKTVRLYSLVFLLFN